MRNVWCGVGYIDEFFLVGKFVENGFLLFEVKKFKLEFGLFVLYIKFLVNGVLLFLKLLIVEF